MLGFLSGLVAALVIIAFRLLIDLPLMYFFDGNQEGFESLPPMWRFLLPVIGAVVLIALLRKHTPEQRQVSVGHVLDRVHAHQGKLPLRNLLLQFFGGAIALLSGQSVGREGPTVHLGAGSASQLGQWLQLPNNSLRTLVGCGVAAAIAASFNTPMAGVIFAMEVILMEYTIAGFVPVILAAVTGAALTQAIFGSDQTFAVLPLQISGLTQLPIIAVCGFIVALFAATFIRLQVHVQGIQKLGLSSKLMLAGVATGSVAIFLPEIMGVGYDTIDLALQGQLALSLLLIISIAKLLLSTLSVGLGVPGGLIGPMLFIGATLGGALGMIAQLLLPQAGIEPGFYALLGMAAMMAAVLNAPLAALITVLELSYNPNMIFPSMVIIITAVVFTRQVFQCDGVFIELLRARGFELGQGPIHRALTQVGVRSVMSNDYVSCHHRITTSSLEQLLAHHPHWLLIEETGKEKYLLAAADAATALSEHNSDDDSINLLEIPGRRLQLQPIDQRASVLDAQELLREGQADALYVERYRTPRSNLSDVAGILTPEHIQDVYQH